MVDVLEQTQTPTNVFAKIDIERRKDIEKNHTATHLMLSAMRKVLGSHVVQRGSYQNDEVTRFDFSHFSKVTDEELLPFIGPRLEAPIFLMAQAQLLIHKNIGAVQRSRFCSMDGTIKGMYSSDGRDSAVRELSSLEQNKNKKSSVMDFDYSHHEKPR